MTANIQTRRATPGQTRTTLTRIAIADGYDLMRAGLRAVLSHTSSIDIIWEATSHRQVNTMMDLAVPDVLLIDPDLGSASSWRSLRTLAAGGMAIILLLKTDSSAAAHPESLLEGGLRLGFGADREELERLIQTATALPPSLRLPTRTSQSHPGGGSEDGRILAMVAAGRTNRQIAGALGVGEEAVKASLRELFARWQVASRSAAVVKAIELGVIE